MFNLRPFQFILLGSFFVIAILGVVAFTQFSGFEGEGNPYGERIVIWGTLDESVITREISRISAEVDERFNVVDYVEKDPRTFADELTNAIAEDRGPDAVFLDHEMILRERPKLFPIPYETLTLRQYRDTYIEGAEIFNLSDGTYGFPIAVDPLVMYYNRDILASEGFAAPPRTWTEIVNETTPRITEVTNSRRIERSALAFGEYTNVQNAKDVLLMLLLQAGSKLVFERNEDLFLELNRAATETSRPPATASLDFYTQFANPSRSVYSWNRSLPMDTDAFLGEDLALYFGFASERESLRRGNPNLNFDSVPVPQGSDTSVKRNYGLFYTLAVLRSSDNREGAYQAAVRLSSVQTAESIAKKHDMAPVHRSRLAEDQLDPFLQTAYESALTSRGWLDPNPAASENIFKIMIEDVTSGRTRISSAVNDAQIRINQLFR